MTHQIQIFDEIDNALLVKIYNELKMIDFGSDIELVIASYGGSILDTVGIIDLLKPYHTSANIIGFACSAAAILAISCDTVNMSENASMLIHSAWSEGIESDDPGIERCNKVQLDIINKRCQDFDHKLIKADTWLSADECLKLGLIDNIYNNSSIDFEATCKKYAAKLSKLKILNKEINMDEVKVDEVIEQVKEERIDEAAEDVVEEAENHDILEVVEKLTDELNALKARVLALEEPAVVEKEEVVEKDEEQERINAIYKNLAKPQASISVGGAKATPKVVHKVDYKAFATFLND